ncbi:MAG TPA: DUF4846 domain-containing protein [Mucilaginibacter sp.]|jgi:hypothetical protein|nr:DUF4846 domain-containing protein [Mucilaginibacter sp.]
MKTLAFILTLLLFVPADNVLTRFRTPAGFHQAAVQPGSFGAYLQSLPLKPTGTHTLTYKGVIAATDVETAAVVDISVGHEDLQQCADAVMRLRGGYLWHAGRYKEIAFHFVSGFKCDYVHYADGYRYHSDHWVLKAKKDYGYNTFMQYMQLVFAYAGTLSLEKELKPVTNPNELKAGDIFIHGGSPGHCFIVMDVVENDKHEKQFLLAQSFMPAQNIQVLQNAPGYYWFSMDKIPSIWYGELVKPQYLRRFEQD